MYTLLNDDGPIAKQNQGAVVPPIYQNSLFTFDSWDDIDQAFDDFSDSYIYSRINNPTAKYAEEKIALLCGGEKAKLTASGISAIVAAVMHCVKSGDHIITIHNVYGPTNNFLSQYLNNYGITTTFVKGTSIHDFINAAQPNTRLIFLESPASMTYELQDLDAVAQFAKSANIKTVIDNTWASPLYQKPLEIGIDIEVHSVSKYISGHSDIVAGAIISDKETINQIIKNEIALLGAKIAPFEAWLILRSLRTLPLRMKKHSKNTKKIIAFLESHPMVRKIIFPGIPSFEQYELGKKQMSGYSGLLSFELNTDDISMVKSFINALKLIKLGVSWGGHESLVYSPTISYSKELTPEQFQAMNIKVGMVRISIGLESAKDLVADLRQALDGVTG